MSVATDWTLTHTYRFRGQQVAYEILGHGPAVVLVHGTPSWSYLWRDVARALSDRFTVHVLDLLGYGTSEQQADQDVSLAVQTRLVAELLDHWGLEQPCIAGHDFGGAITLRLVLLEGRRFRRIALCDAVAIAPWITPFSRHVQRHLEAFRTVPEHIHRQLLATHLRTAIHHEMSDAELEPYLQPWLGSTCQAAYYRQLAQFDERYTREIEPRYLSIEVPTLVLWGEHDSWLAPDFGRQLAQTIPGACLEMIPEAGHFIPEDQPQVLAARLAMFFANA